VRRFIDTHGQQVLYDELAIRVQNGMENKIAKKTNVHSFHPAGAAHLPHRVRAPPHLVFGKSSVWVRRSAINGIELSYTVAQSM